MFLFSGIKLEEVETISLSLTADRRPVIDYYAVEYYAVTQ